MINFLERIIDAIKALHPKVIKLTQSADAFLIQLPPELEAFQVEDAVAALHAASQAASQAVLPPVLMKRLAEAGQQLRIAAKEQQECQTNEAVEEVALIKGVTMALSAVLDVLIQAGVKSQQIETAKAVVVVASAAAVEVAQMGKMEAELAKARAELAKARAELAEEKVNDAEEKVYDAEAEIALAKNLVPNSGVKLAKAKEAEAQAAEALVEVLAQVIAGEKAKEAAARPTSRAGVACLKGAAAVIAGGLGLGAASFFVPAVPVAMTAIATATASYLVALLGIGGGVVSGFAVIAIAALLVGALIGLAVHGLSNYFSSDVENRNKGLSAE